VVAKAAEGQEGQPQSKTLRAIWCYSIPPGFGVRLSFCRFFLERFHPPTRPAGLLSALRLDVARIPAMDHKNLAKNLGLCSDKPMNPGEILGMRSEPLGPSLAIAD